MINCIMSEAMGPNIERMLGPSFFWQCCESSGRHNGVSSGRNGRCVPFVCKGGKKMDESTVLELISGQTFGVWFLIGAALVMSLVLRWVSCRQHM